MASKKIILASASPRRKELLSKITGEFDIIIPSVKEKERQSPELTAKHNAIIKAQSIDKDKNQIVIACDTVVAIGNKIFHKPASRQNAIEMLKELKGKWHKVVSGVAVIYQEEISFVEVSYVKIKNLSNADIEDYVDRFKPYDKAGSYAIQDNVVVESYEGDYDNIVGLPLKKLQKILREINNG